MIMSSYQAHANNYVHPVTCHSYTPSSQKKKSRTGVPSVPQFGWVGSLMAWPSDAGLIAPRNAADMPDLSFVWFHHIPEPRELYKKSFGDKRKVSQNHHATSFVPLL